MLDFRSPETGHHWWTRHRPQFAESARPWYKPWSMDRASRLAFSIVPQGLRQRAWFWYSRFS
jgi:hypothetical protein